MAISIKKKVIAPADTTFLWLLWRFQKKQTKVMSTMDASFLQLLRYNISKKKDHHADRCTFLTTLMVFPKKKHLQQATTSFLRVLHVSPKFF